MAASCNIALFLFDLAAPCLSLAVVFSDIVQWAETSDPLVEKAEKSAFGLHARVCRHEWGNLKAATYQLWYAGLSNWVRSAK
eukprot:3905837-Pyramimonas_sp.AAC.1